LVKPRIVLSKQRPGQEPVREPQEQAVRILSPETAVQMRQMMEGVVLEGTGRKAVLQGYTSAGKTGSAQVYDPVSNTYTHTYNASFLGFAPVGNPRVVIVVTLHGTTGGSAGFGGARAAPVFREVAMSALRLMDVPKDLPDRVLRASVPANENDLAEPAAEGAFVTLEAATSPKTGFSDATSPDFAISDDGGLPRNAAARNQTFDAHNANTVRAGVVSSVTRPLAQGESPVPTGNSPPSQRPFFSEPTTQIAVPDFRGKTTRDVIQQSTAMGVPVEVFGSGMSVRQDPPPGSVLRPGVTVKVQFGR
jgi:cell division protein FtsI (penicillin-binding protein 3)